MFKLKGYNVTYDCYNLATDKNIIKRDGDLIEINMKFVRQNPKMIVNFISTLIMNNYNIGVPSAIYIYILQEMIEFGYKNDADKIRYNYKKDRISIVE